MCVCSNMNVCFLPALWRWCWCSLVQGLSRSKTWCSVCTTGLTAGHMTPVNPASRGWKVRKFKAPHTLRRARDPQARRRARSQGCIPYRGWSSLTAHGTRPTRSAPMRDCKVIAFTQLFKEPRLLVIIKVKFTLYTILFSMISSPRCLVFSSRFAPGRAQGEENMFLAPSEGQTRHLPVYYWGYLLFPQRLPRALRCSGV